MSKDFSTREIKESISTGTVNIKEGFVFICLLTESYFNSKRFFMFSSHINLEQQHIYIIIKNTPFALSALFQILDKKVVIRFLRFFVFLQRLLSTFREFFSESDRQKISSVENFFHYHKTIKNFCFGSMTLILSFW